MKALIDAGLEEPLKFESNNVVIESWVVDVEGLKSHSANGKRNNLYQAKLILISQSL